MPLRLQYSPPLSRGTIGLTASLFLTLALASSTLAQELLPNGSFDDSTDSFKGWITDYEWTGNSHYLANKTKVAVVPGESGHQTVASFTPNSEAGVKMESFPIALEPGFRYKCKFDVKGGPYRVYFAGYKWEPGIRPHEEPELGELRMIYKSKALAEESKSWTTQEISLPGVELSELAIKHLKYVRFITVYVWMYKDGSIDNISVTKTPDPSIKF
jgi:hypothetical protein